MSDSSRFWAKVNKDDPNGCWLWIAHCTANGYGTFGIGGRKGGHIMAHRFAYQELVAQIPEGLDLDHLCRVRRCVNPAHLEPVTRQINILRGISPAAQQARRTECIRGHALSGDNLYVAPSGKRGCRECRRVYLREWFRKKAKIKREDNART